MASLEYDTGEEVEEIKQGFEMFDVDNKGVIDPVELIETMEEMNIKETNPFLYELLQSLSENDNFKSKGGVTYDEFITFLEEKTNNDNSDESIQRIFSVFKDDQTNLVPIQKIHQKVKEVGDEKSDEELKILIEQSHQGGKELTLEEFQKIMNGSENVVLSDKKEVKKKITPKKNEENNEEKTAKRSYRHMREKKEEKTEEKTEPKEEVTVVETTVTTEQVVENGVPQKEESKTSTKKYSYRNRGSRVGGEEKKEQPKEIATNENESSSSAKKSEEAPTKRYHRRYRDNNKNSSNTTTTETKQETKEDGTTVTTTTTTTKSTSGYSRRSRK